MKINPLSLTTYNDQRLQSAQKTICWAPQKSMFIGLRGNITTCCYNKTYLIGKYPNQSLQKIWFSEQRKKQEEALDNNDLSLGCQNCKRIIEAGNFKGLPAKNFDHLPLSNSGFPTKIDFELSNECNLECVMCRGEFSSAIRKNREQLPPIPQPYGDDFLRELEAFIPHLDTCHFLGGEPFLIPIYEEIWEMIRRINPSVRISVQTNATIISTRTKKIIESMNFDIGVSIDSVEKETYEQIRKNANFEKVMNNITYLRRSCQLKGTNFTLSYCPMPQNWQELKQVVQFANKLESKLYFNKVDFPKECSFQSLEVDQLDKILTCWNSLDFPENNSIEKYNKSAAEQVIAQVDHLKNIGVSTPIVLSYDHYLKELRSFLATKGEAEETSFNALKEKLDFILESFGNETSLAEEKLIGIDFSTLYEGLKNIEKEHALHLFNSFILPVPNLNQPNV